MLQLHSQDLSRGDIVAVGETAWNRHNLVLQQQFRIIPQPIDMQPFGDGAGLFERELGFFIAVRSGSSQNEDTRLSHGFFLAETTHKSLFRSEASPRCFHKNPWCTR